MQPANNLNHTIGSNKPENTQSCDKKKSLFQNSQETQTDTESNDYFPTANNDIPHASGLIPTNIQDSTEFTTEKKSTPYFPDKITLKSLEHLEDLSLKELDEYLQSISDHKKMDYDMDYINNLLVRNKFV